jgi:hypothetical protein
MTEAPSDSTKRGHLWWWLLLVPVLLFGACVGWSEWYTRNTAQSLSRFMEEFADAQGAVLYCGNGAGKGLDGANQTPWFEWTLLADGTVDKFAEDLGSWLRMEGFQVVSRQAGPDGRTQEQVDQERRRLAADGWAAEWTEISGVSAGKLAVTGRVASDELFHNNCYEKFDDVITPADPNQFEIVAVVMFKDWDASGQPEQMPLFPPSTSPPPATTPVPETSNTTS